MRPVLFTFQCGETQVVVRAYGTCMAVAAIAVLGLGWAAAVRRGLPTRRIGAVLAATTVATIIGSRMLYALLHPDLYRQSPEWFLSLRPTGFAVDGGLLLAVAAGWFVCRLVKISPWQLADALAAPLALGDAIMRLGCFLNGCCFGRPTSMPWGVTYPLGSHPHLHQAAHCLDVLLSGPVPVHPAPLYEAAAMLVAAGVALPAARRHPPDGAVALSVAAWFVVFRWFNTWFRATGQTPPFSGAMATIWVLLIVAGVIAIARRARRAPLMGNAWYRHS
jgi:phosphatidylglycerol---prolipoprotein diacylglyceryl transferase